MKKHLLVCFLVLTAILCLKTAAWSQEASVFDSVEKIMIRAFITGDSQPYSAWIEVRDKDGAIIDPSKLVVMHDDSKICSVTTTTKCSSTSNCPEGETCSTPAANPFKIHDGDLVNEDISISLDNDPNDGGTTYVHCVKTGDNPTTGHVMKYEIVTLLPADGVCGTTLNACTSGAFVDVTDSGTQYLWSCNGINGSAVNDSCSLLIPVNGVCGTTLNACASGTFVDVTDSSTQYLWSCNGKNGSTVNDSCSLLIPVNGVCGTTLNACTSGTFVDVTDSSTQYLWSCNGKNGSTVNDSCSSNKSTGGQIDLGISNFSAPSSANAACAYKWTGTVSITNYSSVAAQSFTLKWYLGGCVYDPVYNPSCDLSNMSVVGTNNISGLAGGATTSTYLTTCLSVGAHTYKYMNVVVTPNSLDTDTKPTNNYTYRMVQGI